MAINYPGPYEVRILYQDTGVPGALIEHTQRLNVALVEPATQGAAFSTYNFIDINSVNTNTLDTLVEDYLTEMLKQMSLNCAITAVELWKYPTAQSFDSIFWSSYVPVANTGTGAGSPISAGQTYFVFRTQEGGTMKLSLMESRIAAGSPVAYASLGANEQALVDFILDGDGAAYSAPFLARDTSYPFSPGKMFPGRNEKLWKDRNGR